MHWRLLTSCLVSLYCSVGAVLAIEESEFYRQGTLLFKKQEYLQAFDSFAKAVQTQPDNAEAAYYLAVTLHHLGHLDKAKEQYKIVVDGFPGTAAAQQAATILRQLSVAKQAESAGLPKETWVKYERRGNSIEVDGLVNNHPVKFDFDTGAERCLLTPVQLKQLGLPMPTGSPSGYGAGIGQTKPIPVWHTNVDLKVGRIERRNFPILVSSVPMDFPLLGQDFYCDFEYSIDTASKTISFRQHGLDSSAVAKKAAPPLTVDSAGHYVFSVPFVKEGNSLIVSALINGKNVPMVFDTGAVFCLFSKSEASHAGISIDTRRPAFPISGLSGQTMAQVGVIGNIKLGPIERHNFAIGISDQANTAKPLLGQDFVGDWNYTIDNQQQVIRFTKGLQ
ncbi:MAG: retroviral-like aspartic protease family protein [Candidatus Melainabacteria bacterium]|nr:retroviral-like aspartic protease family protein [Candidatus Melainabacteria bacterium]